MTPIRVTRRWLLGAGAALGGAAALSACGGTPGDGGDAGGDEQLVALRTAASLELHAAAVYRAITGNLEPLQVNDPLIRLAARVAGEHHVEHATTLNDAVESLGGAPYTAPNPTLAERFRPRLAGLAGQTNTALFAVELEEALVATHQVTVARVLRTPELRAMLIGIAGAEARHAAYLSVLGRRDPHPHAFEPTERAYDDDVEV